MIKDRPNKYIDTIYECGTNGINNGVFFVTYEDEKLDGRIITVNGKKAVNFGTCSYLNLEIDERLKSAAIEAINKHGVHYSSSRAYSGCPLTEELESLLFKIFDNNHTVLAGSTTLTHIAVMPILFQEKDYLILDQKVHGSVQMAAQLLKARGTAVDMIRHNNMTMLEEKIKENPNKYDQIWYMADGVYSMFGDFAPIKDILYLLDKYDNFFLYIDDAHGMSWTGKNGSGYVLSQIKMHPKIFLTTSLGKGFGVGGGVFVMSDNDMKRKIATCGSSYTFSGPLQPPLLGALIASAKIHLSDEITERQNKLRAKINLAKSLIQQYDLPEVQASDSPIMYLALGQPRVGYNMLKRLLNEGFFTNIGIFPTVPVNCTGVRLPITLSQTDEDIKNVIAAFAHHFPLVLAEEKISIENLTRSFKEDFEPTKKRYPHVAKIIKSNNTFKIQHENSIDKIDKKLWNELLGGNGNFDWEGCKFIEETFKNNPLPEDNWDIHYLIIKDSTDTPILATFFSVLISKDDMASNESVSQQIEEKRKTDKYYMSSKVIIMGSLLSEGNHLFLDRNNPSWKKAMLELIKIMSEVKHKTEAAAIQIRDIDTEDEELREFLIGEGFFRFDLPDSHIIDINNNNDIENFISNLSKKSRYHVRSIMQKNEHLFRVSYNKEITEKDIAEIYKLYLNIKRQSFKINTYDLPQVLFEKAIKHPNWDLISIRIKENEALCCFVLCYQSELNNFCPIIIGLDYNLNKEFSCYRQGLFQIVKRGLHNNAKNIYLGMDASIEKRKLGAKILPKSLYMQAEDTFSMESISILKQNNE